MKASNSIWLPLDFSKWEDQKYVYINGSRGTGKTFLLKAFNWHNRLYDEPLKALIGKDPFEKEYIGIYLNIPDFVNFQFNNWFPESELTIESWIEEREIFYSLYLECQIIQLLIGAIQGLRSERIMKFSPNNEFEAVNKILSTRSELKNFLVSGEEYNRLCDLKHCFYLMHENIRVSASKNEELKRAKNYPNLQIGNLIEDATVILLDLCSLDREIDDLKEADVKRAWKLKVCIDLDNVLESYQQKTIDTLLKHLKGSQFSFIVASRNKNFKDGSTYCLDSSSHPTREIYYLDIYKRNLKSQKFPQPLKEFVLKRVNDLKNIYINDDNILASWIVNSLLSYSMDPKILKNNNVGKFVESFKINVSDELFNINNTDSFLGPLKSISSSDNIHLIKSSMQLCQNITKIHFKFAPILFPTYLIEILQLELSKEKPKQLHEMYITQNESIRNLIKKKLIDANEQENISFCERIQKERKTQQEDIVAFQFDDNFEKKQFDRLYVLFNSCQKGYDEPLNSINDSLKMAQESLCINSLRDISDDGKMMIRVHKVYTPKFKFPEKNLYCKFSIDINDILKICETKKYKKNEEIYKEFFSKCFEVHYNGLEDLKTDDRKADDQKTNDQVSDKND